MELIRCLDANSVGSPITGDVEEYQHIMKGRNKEICMRFFSNELGQLTHGMRDIPGTNIITTILKSNISKDKRVTYGKIVCELKPHKEVLERNQLTVGGNNLDFTGNLSTPTATAATEK